MAPAKSFLFSSSWAIALSKMGAVATLAFDSRHPQIPWLCGAEAGLGLRSGFIENRLRIGRIGLLGGLTLLQVNRGGESPAGFPGSTANNLSAASNIFTGSPLISDHELFQACRS